MPRFPLANTPGFSRQPHPAGRNTSLVCSKAFRLASRFACRAVFFALLIGVLKWARANKCPWDERSCALAARGGHLDILQWCRTNDCPWNEMTCAWAAAEGHLGLLQWARANGCPWDERTTFKAAEGGHQGVLDWCRANGCPE